MTLEEALGDWLRVIDKELLFKVVKYINVLYANNRCAPEYKDIFKVFKITPYKDLRCLWLLQDPYPQ